MAEFYEFHDSYLTQIERREQLLILRIDAYRHTWPEGFKVNSGTGWTQPIEITIEEPSIVSEIVKLPVRILGGSIKSNILRAKPEDILGHEIPASLSGTSAVDIEIEGLEESTCEYTLMQIRGKSAAVTHKGEARFVENLPMRKVSNEGTTTGL
jgi:hypothetical protein